MTAHDHGQRMSLTIDVEPDLRRQIEHAAATRDLSVRDYVVAVLEQATAAEASGESRENQGEWAQLSARSFARDWQSDEDRVYDNLP